MTFDPKSMRSLMDHLNSEFIRATERDIIDRTLWQMEQFEEKRKQEGEK